MATCPKIVVSYTDSDFRQFQRTRDGLRRLSITRSVVTPSLDISLDHSQTPNVEFQRVVRTLLTYHEGREEVGGTARCPFQERALAARQAEARIRQQTQRRARRARRSPAVRLFARRVRRFANRAAVRTPRAARRACASPDFSHSFSEKDSSSESSESESASASSKSWRCP